MGLPFYLQMHDDFAYSSRGYLTPKRAHAAMQSAWRNAKARFVICDQLGNEYCRRYGGRDYIIVTDGLENVASAVRWIKHVHVADKEGRVPPGESGTADYRPLFRILKAGGYDSLISVEANFPEPDIRAKGAKVLDFLKRQWQEA